MKNVLITGSNRGIGLGFVRHHLAAGDHVVACCRNPEDADELTTLAQDHPHHLRIVELDLTHPHHLGALVERLHETDTHPDLVISNAGVSHEQAFGSCDPAAVRETFEVNAVGPLLLAQALVPLMPRGSTLVHLSSGLASIQNAPQSGPVYDAYAMSKAAINMLTRRLAAPLAQRGVVVLALSPGWVQTDMGGGNAELTVADSVRQMSDTLARVGASQSGHYLNLDGSPLPW